MPRNPAIYPDDFVTSRSLGSIKTTLTIESAVSSIEIQARDTALRQAHTRRIAGQNEIANQNKLLRIASRLMPLNQVGTVVASSPILGKTAYFGGGRQESKATNYITTFLFSNEIFKESDLTLSSPRLYVGTVGNNESGKICGGQSTVTGTFYDAIDKITFNNGAGKLQKIAAVLSQGLLGAVGGMGDKVKGILVGGVAGNGKLTRDAHVYTHAIDEIRVIANQLTTARFAPHNGLSSKTAGYVWLGSEKFYNGAVVRVIDKTIYDSNLVATPISTTATQSQVVHASFSNPRRGHIAGGFVNAQGALSNSITGFTFSGETSAILSATLDQPRVCVDGTGSSVAGYTVGGSTATAASTKTVQKYDYATDINRVIDAQLTIPLADQGAIADYGPGFSYN